MVARSKRALYTELIMEKNKDFIKANITKIFTEKKSVLDIGGGLRISKKQGNRFDPSRAWIAELAKDTTYHVMDPVPDFNPDVVGDIHHMPFEDGAYEAIVCESVLEHVEDPIRAAQELYRVTAKGGYCFVYVPFLYYYHAEQGYYKDFWRFTEDAIRYIFRDFSSIEISPVRGPLQTWFHLNPFTQRFEFIAKWLDGLRNKNSKQVSGYSIFLIK